ncbi:NFACT RNA binding domain-containing protein [Vagococcus carniphilus]|uniref:Rqc2 homolog RqcH n=1 Tax=Vagococcus carniphilus TaxID=218144 RepID=A0AAW8U8E5_9ENTE|nr:NFACT RNA binding domain-containing protein [Vagococcus carniphilus]MDT2831990.1 NFACT RNA binding domain-containing protein [Vagococcus carniphilus]MDT2834607.1 NFACT RNA binding domain-containing protein [Vagococcus carniphilus]MDT2840869.1 NFACT RNA binding domain-containing protein [Vagococcus carniphilus]MDT2855533.1 NFACT RNA binding domain-containing protein [Vagococcus carniphilus]
MSFDGIFTQLMTKELNETISGGRISKIHQPYENEIMLIIRNKGKNHTLLLSAHPSYSRVQITEINYTNPQTPPNFCMVMRKFLEGSILQKIEQVKNDRILQFSFSSRNELGDLENIILTIELMGRHSNIILYNQSTNKIIDSIKHIGPSVNSYRSILPGVEYVFPPSQEKIDPFNVDSTQLFELLNTAETIDASFIQQHFQGFGKDTAKELVFRINQDVNNKFNCWKSFFKALTEKPSPCFYNFEDKEYFTPIPFETLGDDVTHFDTLSKVLDGFYEGKAERDRVKQQAGELFRKVKNDQVKIKKKMKKFEQSLIDADNAEVFRIKGELLTTFLHQVPRGKTKVSLENYYDNNELLDISLNEALTPNQNAQKYFQRYQKLKNSVKIVKEQLEKANYELIYLESIESQLELASPKDIDLIREELISEGYVKDKQKKKKMKPKKSEPETFYSSTGVKILVGKNNLQNDQLTLKTANKTDTWLHAKDIPGSHVVIKDKEPDETTLLEAAHLAAYYSKYRLSAQVPVDYVLIKHIKKPNGAKPGYVIYENQRTLYVTPRKSFVEKGLLNGGQL